MSLIATYLEAEIKRELRQHGIIVWLDKDDHYTAFVDGLIEHHTQGHFFAPVIAFRGSYLEMILALEPYGNGLAPERLLIHMPGHTAETITKTPVLELYRAGVRFRKALKTLIREAVTGHLNPAEIETYLKQDIPDLAAAEIWLQTALNQPRDGLAARLNGLDLKWILDGLLSPQKLLQADIFNPADLEVLVEHLHRHTGFDRPFIKFFHGDSLLSFTDLGDTFAAWLMCVEYTNDLARLPHLAILQPLQTSLSKPLKQTCATLLDHLRDRYPDIYAEKADRAESQLQEELGAIQPEDLGKIDTFQREETAVLKAAIVALETAQWDKALQWSQTRITADSFWLNRDPIRRIEWSLIQTAAQLGHQIQQQGRSLQSAHTLREAIELYTQSAYQCDRDHRRIEQERLKLLNATLPHFHPLQSVYGQLRRCYRQWADQLTQDFSTICQTEGFLPEPDLQQRTLYDQVVHPLTQTQRKVAYFLIDAFRYEMATELLADLAGAGTTVHLKARYAELPTITAVGMNVLAPVHKGGRLILAGSDGFKGFKTGEYTVSKPADRVRAMGERSIDRTSKTNKGLQAVALADVCNWSTEKLKQKCGKAVLLVVHSKEIDDAGEANSGTATFELWLQQIKSAWHHLKVIGINEFVFTADHGFLIKTEPTEEPTQEITYGSKRDPNRRHIFESEARSENGMVSVSLNALNYEGQAGYLMFRNDTAVFATGHPGATFVHGGNSLQERVIPVLCVSHRYKSDLVTAQYRLEAEVRPESANGSCIRLRIKPAPDAQSVFNFFDATTVDVGLRVPGREDIQLAVKAAIGAVVKNQLIALNVDGTWVEVLFDLKGQQDERVRVEAFHPDVLKQVEPITPSDYFNVAGSLKSKSTADHLDPSQPPQAEVMAASDWQASFDDEGIRNVFLHLQKHGSINELELTNFLGNPRKVRRFAVDFEAHLKKVPFPVQIETTSSGKRYVRQR
jgi:hypothetical protein